jgi:hypothetical protein
MKIMKYTGTQTAEDAAGQGTYLIKGFSGSGV